MDAKGWDQRWHNNDISWHDNNIHQFLKRYYDDLTDKRCQLRILLPLCGKALELAWLAEKGNQVIGIEYSHLAIQNFFQEHNLKFIIKDIEGTSAKLFNCEDGTIMICACDFFNASVDWIGGQVDAIWDSGAMEAINITERQRYANTIMKLLKPDGKLLLSIHDFDHNKCPGPPYCFYDGELEKLFGENYNVKMLEDKDIFDPEKHSSWGLSALRGRVFLIQNSSHKDKY